MKPLYRKPVIFVMSKLNARRWLSSSTLTHQYHGSRRFEEESRGVRVSVWWDVDNCQVPSNANVLKVIQSITNAPSINGIKGPMHITAFGDVTRIPRANLELLSAVGVHVTHFPSGGQSRLIKLMHWALENPPPHHLFLISGDEVYADILHQLRRSNYNILLSGPEDAPSVLRSAATMMWHWTSLLKGDNLSGKLFNYPPDGPNSSLYGYFRAPLEDPFPASEQSLPLPATEISSEFPFPASEQSLPLPATEISAELGSESRYRPIPESVTRLICQILSSYPEGISITQLRAELAKSGLTIDKDLYGHKKFSRFLLAMPHALKLHSGEDGRFLVQGIKPKFLDESAVVLNKERKTSNELSDSFVSALRPNGGMTSAEEVSKQSMMMPPVHEVQLQSKSGNKIESQKEGKSSADYMPMQTHDFKVRASAKDMEKEMGQKESSRKRGFNEMHNAEETMKLIQQPEKIEMSSPLPEVASPVAEVASQAAEVALSADEIKDSSEKLESTHKVDSDNSPTPKYGIFRRLWMKIFGWGKDQAKADHELMTEDNQKPENQDKTDQENISLKNHSIFSKDTFWEELGFFIDTAQGLALFSQSKTREHLAHSLGEHGPEVLRSLPIDDLLHLVDLLISDRKWIEELESQTFPFKVIRSSKRNASTNDATSSLNSLSHIFTSKQRNVGESDEGKLRNSPSGRVPATKPKGEILADCQKLVDEIVDNHPSGYKIGLFRRHFMEKYGYALNVQKLGYEKLVILLQDMRGIRIESAMILPSAALNVLDQNPVDLSIQESKSDKVGGSESSELSVKEDESDSAWDELGPVDYLLTKKVEKENRFSSLKSQKGKRQQLTVPEYELPVENDFSDSDEEASLAKASPNGVKSNSGDEDSSLIQILDQWYGEVEDNNQTKRNVLNDAEASCSNAYTAAMKNDAKYPKKQRYGKSYSFVSGEASEDNFVHGVLNTLKKSGDKSSESRAEGERLSASQ